MIRLIIFDFSGTLAHYAAGEYRNVAEKLREFNLPVSDEQVAKLEEKLPAYFSEAASWKELTDKVVQKLGIVLEADRRESLEAFLERRLTCRLYEDAESVLSLPQDKAVLTLSGKFVVSSIPELRHFEVFSPEIAGAAKPDLKAFLAVLEKMQADPEEAVMVGDSLENDILPALAIGMKAVLIDRENKVKVDDPAIIKIASLKELKRFL
ncbi:MAG: HAD family hydrolase [Candidatus Pacebacteria bacterium]|jgi:putative hydrolase of the HAD superfamily|nr:HAD family hydrolase [Candidatus Paceibacterota bacterium]